MAVTKTVVGATPYEQDGNVVRWSVEMRYEDGIEDTDSYYTSTFSTNVDSTDRDDEEVFEDNCFFDDPTGALPGPNHRFRLYQRHHGHHSLHLGRVFQDHCPLRNPAR